MDWIELTIHTTTAGADIVSEALMAEGATGTMVEDRADIPDPNKPNGYWEIIDPNLIASMPEDVLVHAWFTPDSSFADRMQALRSRCDGSDATCHIIEALHERADAQQAALPTPTAPGKRHV